MRALLTLAASLGMALAALGLAFAAPGTEPEGELAAARIHASSGAVQIVNSREGAAVLGASGLRPGGGVIGTVRIGNGGTVAGRFALRPGALVDVPGLGGGLLSLALRLEILDVTDVAHPIVLYQGPAAGVALLQAGRIAPGASRDYRVTATLETPPGDDNRFQGASLSLGLEWGATAVAVATPAPTPKPKPPAPKPKPKPTPTPKPPVPATPLADAIGLPGATTCVKRRTLKVRLRAPKGGRVLSATIAVNGKVKARVKGWRASAPVTLRKLPKGPAKVAVTLKASDRKTYKVVRTYAACR